MHIPASMLHGQVCPVTLAVGAASVAAGFKIYSRCEKKVSVSRWAGVTALIFAMQMLNFPVMHGTSGHLVGGVLAASLLGIPAGILSLSLILFVQAAFFADGGMNAWGANMINMALIGVGGGGLILKYLEAKRIPQTIAIGLASATSVVMAALACSVEVALCGVNSFAVIAKAMLPVHLLIGVGEGILTVALWKVLSVFLATTDETKISRRLALCCGTALLLSPLASSFPDGLETAAMQLGIKISQVRFFFSWLEDYRVAFIGSRDISTVAAGLAGVAVVWFLTWGMAKKIARG